MRIFYSSDGGDPMLLDREEALHAFAAELRELATGTRGVGVFPAQTSGDPAPYMEFLNGVRIEMGSATSAELRVATDRWLELRMSRADLSDLAQRVQRLRNGNHAHLYSGPVGLIVEADDTWPGFDQNDG